MCQLHQFEKEKKRKIGEDPIQPQKEAHRARNYESKQDQIVVYYLCFRMVQRALHGLHKDLKQKKKKKEESKHEKSHTSSNEMERDHTRITKPRSLCNKVLNSPEP